MATSCIVDDYMKRRRASLQFTEAHFAPVISAWHSENRMLNDLQGIEMFKGRKTWADLDPAHFRILITNTFNNRDKMVEPTKHYDDSIPLVGTLYFLLMGLVYSLQYKTGTAVDVIRVMRVSELDVTFEFILTMMPEEKKKDPEPESKNGLRVIVDNTDE